ncbi:MAG: cell division protein ZapE, partial [Alcaligenaceae bacterium]|nr:cell division protein ZapE [Alcaligenaceae bacterium]
LQDIFDRLLDTAPQKPVLTVENRELKAVALGGSIVWFDFATLCGGPRSQNDYLDLASRFQTIILSDVPRMAARQASEARRFTWLIDVLYDHKVKLIMSADCEPEELYVQGPMANEFHRTVSRILEMQSREYLESERRETVAL